MTTKVKPTVEKWGGDQEVNKCEFCGVVKPVQRYYLTVKNKHFDDNKGGCYSTFTYYCQDCGIEDTLSVQEAKAEEDNRTYLFVENYLKSWGGYYNAEKEYKHIESTRITKKALLKEISLLCKWQERALDRTKGAMEMIKKLSSGEKVSNQDLLSTLNTKDSLKQEEEA